MDIILIDQSLQFIHNFSSLCLFLLLSEVANHKQFDYVEMDGVKYGFVPSANKRFGWMRFSPGAKKAHEISSGVIVRIYTTNYTTLFLSIKRI